MRLQSPGATRRCAQHACGVPPFPPCCIASLLHSALLHHGRRGPLWRDGWPGALIFIIIKSNCPYWSIDAASMSPLGAKMHFCIASDNMSAVVSRVISAYSDGTPRRMLVQLRDGTMAEVTASTISTPETDQ